MGSEMCIRDRSLDYLETLSEMSEVTAQERFKDSRQVEEIDMVNMNNLHKLMDAHQEFVLVVEHDVVVEGKTRPFRFYINLLEMASIMVASFCSMESYTRSNNVLAVDKHSLKLIVVIALALRSMIDKTITDLTDDSCVMWVDGVEEKKRTKKQAATESTADYSFPTAHGLSLADFLPPLSKRKETLWSMLINLKAEEYQNKHVPLNTEGDSGRADGLNENEFDNGDVDDKDAIEADGDVVFRL